MEVLQENALAIIAVIGGATILFKFAMWMNKVNSDRDIFKDFMKEIREDIKKIHEKINRIDNTTVSSGSPLHLTGLGADMGQVRAAVNRRSPSIATKEEKLDL